MRTYEQIISERRALKEQLYENKRLFAIAELIEAFDGKAINDGAFDVTIKKGAVVIELYAPEHHDADDNWSQIGSFTINKGGLSCKEIMESYDSDYYVQYSDDLNGDAVDERKEDESIVISYEYSLMEEIYSVPAKLKQDIITRLSEELKA